MQQHLPTTIRQNLQEFSKEKKSLRRPIRPKPLQRHPSRRPGNQKFSLGPCPVWIVQQLSVPGLGNNQILFWLIFHNELWPREGIHDSAFAVSS